MLEGVCPQCNVHCHGQALSIQKNQLCMKCGNALEIRNEGSLLCPAPPAVMTEEYHFSSEVEEWENLCTKNLLIYLTLN